MKFANTKEMLYLCEIITIIIDYENFISYSVSSRHCRATVGRTADTACRRRCRNTGNNEPPCHSGINESNL